MLNLKYASLAVCSSILFLSGLQTFAASSSIQSALLLSLDDLRDSSSNQRRSKHVADGLKQGESTSGSDVLYGPDSEFQQSAFIASHGNAIPVSSELVSLLEKVFAEEQLTESDLQDAISYLLDNNAFGLSRESVLSALKSTLVAYSGALKSNNTLATNAFDNVPYLLLRSVLPKVKSLGGKGTSWIRDLSQITMEAAGEEQSQDTLNSISAAFAEEVFLLMKDPEAFFNDRSSIAPPGSAVSDIVTAVSSSNTVENPTETMREIAIFPGITDVEPSRTEIKPEMDYGGLSGFNPDKVMAFQELAIGLAQGFLNSSAKDTSLLPKHFLAIGNGSLNPSSSNNGKIEASISSAFIESILDQVHLLDPQNQAGPGDNGTSLFAYESLKAISTGFVLASSVAASSSDKYLDKGLHLESAESISKSISQAAILHSFTDPESNQATWTVDILNAGRLTESIAQGAAMGSQLAMVQPRSMDYGDNYEVFTNSRREIAKSVARGVANGAVNASAWLNTIDAQADAEDSPPVISSDEIEEVSRGASLGAMIGNTGLAVYYPTDQLVPIINFTAQGASYGSTSSSNLSSVTKEGTETIDVAISRESAMGAAMGATFEPTVLLGLRPDLRSRDAQSMNHLEAASFGSTYGAILGIQANPNPPSTNNKLGTAKEDRLVELKQSSKQGSIEGALSGAQLALGLEDTSQETFKSKASILKVINAANVKAASNSSSSSSLNSLRTNSSDMLLLMKKFGINPRFTNPAKLYKRPVVVQIDEPPIDEKLKEDFKDASPL